MTCDIWKKVPDIKPWGRLNLVMEIRKVLFVFLTNNMTLWLMIQFYLGRNKSKELSEEGALCRKAKGWIDLRIWKRTPGVTIKKARDNLLEEEKEVSRAQTQGSSENMLRFFLKPKSNEKQWKNFKLKVKHREISSVICDHLEGWFREVRREKQ